MMAFMEIGVGRLLRLRESIQGTLDSANRREGERSPFAGSALAEGHNRYRAEVFDLLKDYPDFVAEFERMCPAFIEQPPPNFHALFEQDAFMIKATSALLQMSGWLSGLIQEAEMEMNARAYAEAKLKEDRGVGFRP